MASNQVFALSYSPPLKVVFSILNKRGRCNFNINSSNLLIWFLIFNRDFNVVCLCLCWLQDYSYLVFTCTLLKYLFSRVFSTPYIFKTGLLLCSSLGGGLSIISLFASLRTLTSSGPIPTWMDRTITHENPRKKASVWTLERKQESRLLHKEQTSSDEESPDTWPYLKKKKMFKIIDSKNNSWFIIFSIFIFFEVGMVKVW